MNKPIDKKMKLNRRTVIKSALGAGAVFSTPYFFVKANAASDPKVLNMYNFDGSLGESYTKHWYDPFIDKFDIKMNHIKLKGSRVPLEKVQAQIAAGKPETDVMPMHKDQVIFSERNNLAMEVDASAIPEFANYYDQGVTKYGPKMVVWCYGLAYNTELVKPAPTSWKVLWDPEYAGRVDVNEGLKDQTLQMVNLAFKGSPYPVDAETFKHLSN
jgi:putative spermidine/putrescine transport system substrate-binding protein